MLLSQAARLTAERHPLDERLRRIDVAMAEHARKVARRDALRQQWEAARAQAILDAMTGRRYRTSLLRQSAR